MNRFCTVFLFLIFRLAASNICQEYWIPLKVIRQYTGGAIIALAHKRTTGKMELILYDTYSKQSLNEFSFFTCNPQNITIKPSKKGFFFLEDERIQVKDFVRRRPKILDPYEPIYNFGNILWIDDYSFCMHAQRGKNFGIFQMTIDADILTLVAFDGVDCIYPYKMKNYIFYVEHISKVEHVSKNEKYHIVRVPYPKMPEKKQTISIEDLFNRDNERSPSLVSWNDREVIASHDRPIISLSMIDLFEGFFVDVIGDEKKQLFNCYHIKMIQKEWQVRFLFSFSMPASFFDYAAPRCFDNVIYFSSFSDNNLQGDGVNLYSYDLSSGIKMQLTFGKGQESFFAPITVGDQLFYGGTSGLQNRKVYDL